jgi:hypothetical protein
MVVGVAGAVGCGAVVGDGRGVGTGVAAGVTCGVEVAPGTG